VSVALPGEPGHPSYMHPAAAGGHAQGNAARRQRARKAGLASGRARRRLCAARRERQREGKELPLEYPVAPVDREEFERRAMAWYEQHGIRPNAGGIETRWQLYIGLVRVLKVKSQSFCTTNGQRSRALEKAGRPRCTRTVQRQHIVLREMGLLTVFHDRRGGAGRRPGSKKDRLRVQFAAINVAPPSAAQARSASRSLACALPQKRGDLQGRTASAAPPDGGRCDSPAQPGCNDGYRERGDEPLTGKLAQLALDWGLEAEVYAASGVSS